MLLSLPRQVRASGMFAEAHTDGFHEFFRMRAASVLGRGRSNTNSTHDCPRSALMTVGAPHLRRTLMVLNRQSNWTTERVCQIKVVEPTMSEQKSQHNSMLSDKRLSQWESLMRKFSEANKQQCKALSLDIPRAPRSKKQFPTGSQYEGTWDVLGMSGFGTYTFSNGVIYDGEFEDGMFQGCGELRYPSGATLRGQWNKGHMTERTLIFADGLEYSDSDWKYCQMPDRRFTIEYDRGLQPAGKSYLTAEQPTREIPPGYYDTSDGFYDPKTKVVYKPDDITAIIRSPSVREQNWILQNCRTCPDTAVGPRPDLYEEWTKPLVNTAPLPQPATALRGRTRLYIPSASELDENELAFSNLQGDESDTSSYNMSTSNL